MGPIGIERYFAASLPRWERIYDDRTLYANIYQERLAAALGLVDRLALDGKTAALDLGCGPGFGTIGLLRRGFAVEAADVVPEMIERTLARARAENLAERLHGQVATADALPFGGAAFDLVFMIGVSEWLETLDGAFGEIARVLKPGGHLVVSADNRWALSFLADPLKHPLVVPLKRALGSALRLVWQREREPRTQAYPLSALDRALGRAGLTRTTRTTLGFGPFTFCNRALFSERLGLALDRRLKTVALLRASGLVHLLTARKS
jgi:SAM-dependent methyltransferase